MAKEARLRCRKCGAVHIIREDEDGGFELDYNEPKANAEGGDDENGKGKEKGKREGLLDFLRRLDTEDGRD